MIVDMVRGDVLKSGFKDIAFAVNAEGLNDAGFAGLVAARFWPGLANVGKHKLGVVLESSSCDAYKFHAVVCHSLSQDGWKKTPKILEQVLDDGVDLREPRDPLAIVQVGGGPVGQAMGADPFLIMGAMARSQRRVVVFTL